MAGERTGPSATYVWESTEVEQGANSHEKLGAAGRRPPTCPRFVPSGGLGRPALEVEPEWIGPLVEAARRYPPSLNGMMLLRKLKRSSGRPPERGAGQGREGRAGRGWRVRWLSCPWVGCLRATRRASARRRLVARISADGNDECSSAQCCAELSGRHEREGSGNRGSICSNAGRESSRGLRVRGRQGGRGPREEG